MLDAACQACAPLIPRLTIAAVSLAVLMVQIAATRLLSATVAYHAAFAVLALVMLALAGSAAAVYRDRSRAGGAAHGVVPAAKMAIGAGAILAATAIAYVALGALGLQPGVYQTAHVCTAAFGLYASFHACGYVVGWLLASWPRDVGRVYFADLVGAATGALIAVPVLTELSPIQVLIASGLVVTISGLLLGRRESGFVRRYGWVAIALAALTITTWAAPSIVRLRSAKMQDQSTVLFEQWNHLARLTVSQEIPGTRQAIQLLERTRPAADAEAQVRTWAVGWAMSDRWQGLVPKSLWIQLDSDAGTQMIERGGTRPINELGVLQWDVTSAAYWLRPGNLRRAFVIGGGGGRDFLTALSFGADAVDVVELNPLVIEAVQDRFKDFSGQPYTRAGVQYRIGDARTELSRSSQRYDLIQMSMIDTWAASMSGALTLSENALYTREAFHTYVDHLNDEGMLTVSRWYDQQRYAETARVLSLMADALRSVGVKKVGQHVAVVFNSSPYGPGVATCILKRSPFTSAEHHSLVALGQRTGFGLLWPDIRGVTLHHSIDVDGVLSGQPTVIADSRYDLSPPSDDRPFFFNTTRLRQIVDFDGGQTALLFAILTAIILIVGHRLVVRPLAMVELTHPAPDRFAISTALPEVTYFAAIGAAFMAAELGVLQRYIVFLGHPTYALAVVLFSLLLSTAVGSFVSGYRLAWARLALPLLIVGLAATALGVPVLLRAWHSWPLVARLVVAAALIAPLGLCMGAAFPSGVRALHAGGADRLVPWMWAVNGLAGTLSSVVGMLLAMELGYTALLLAATVGYAIAWAVRPKFTIPRPTSTTTRTIGC
ncbi:MAG: hypothetical protein ACRD2N_21820 [Vicinamibacterales bacterium]